MPDSIYAHSGIPPSETLKAFKERTYLRRPRGAGVATAIGIVTVICAILGIAYNASTLSEVVSGSKDAFASERELTHFRAAFYAMSATCVSCYVALLWGGYQLIRLRLSVSGLLIGVWILEICYFLLVGVLWLVPGVGMSIAGATGVANGGLMVQFVTLLPIWGPLAILWLKRPQASPSGAVAA